MNLKRILFEAIVSTALAVSVCHADAETIRIAVSPNGECQTLEDAKRKIAYLENTHPEYTDYEIVFADGEYSFDETVVFTNDDTDGAKIRITAENDGKVSFTTSSSVSPSDFTSVSDTEYLNRFPSAVRDKVKALDISGFCGADFDIDKFSLYVNGKSQSLSEWPRGRYSYTSFDIGSAGNTIIYHNSEPDTWGSLSGAFVGGYFEYDYDYARFDILSQNKQSNILTLDGANVRCEQSRRFKVYNLPEEIRGIGDYCIDTDNKILYYYTGSDFSSSGINISYSEIPMIRLEGASGIEIDGISFTKSSSDAVSVTHSNKLSPAQFEITNCSFLEMKGRAILVSGDVITSFLRREYAKLNGYLSECFGLDTESGAENSIISNNIFCNLSKTAVEMSSGGNEYTLTKSGNVIENNFFSRACLDRPTDPVLKVFGIGTTVRNNTFKSGSGQQILHNGFMHEILRNEITSSLKDVQDAGAIYAGRSLIKRGAVISENVISDYLPASLGVVPHNRGIYCDDELCEQVIERNIISNGDKAITFSGSSGVVKGNISVNNKNGFVIAPYENMWTALQRQKYEYWVNGQASSVYADMPAATYSLWNNTFESIMLEYNRYLASGICEGLFVTAKDNLTVGRVSGISSGIEGRGGINENNLLLESYDGFVAPSTGDYRVVGTIPSVPSLTNFEMTSVGVQDGGLKQKILADKSIALKYPQDNASVSSRTLSLGWYPYIASDRYHVEVSRNAEFSDIIVDEYTYETTLEKYVSGLVNGVYYWRCHAVSDGIGINQTVISDVRRIKITNVSDICAERQADGIRIYISSDIADNTSLDADDGEIAYLNPEKTMALLSGGSFSGEIRAVTQVFGGAETRRISRAKMAALEYSNNEIDFERLGANDFVYVLGSGNSDLADMQKFNAATSGNSLSCVSYGLYMRENAASAARADSEYGIVFSSHEPDGYVRGIMPIVRANNIKSVGGQLYASGYAVDMCWGNIQLMKLDGSMSLSDANVYQNSSVLLVKSIDSVSDETYSLRLKTENLADGAVKIDVYYSELGDFDSEPIATYIDRNNPILDKGISAFRFGYVPSGVTIYDVIDKSGGNSADAVLTGTDADTVSFSDDTSGSSFWSYITPPDMSEGTAVINHKTRVLSSDGRLEISDFSTVNGILIPSDDFNLYRANASVLEFESTTSADNCTPQAIVNLNSFKRPSNGEYNSAVYNNAMWHIHPTGYAVSICYGNLVIKKFSGATSDELQSLASGAQYDDTKVWLQYGYKAGEKYKFRITTTNLSSSVIIEIQVAPYSSQDYGRVYRYIDTSPASGNGAFAFSPWTRSGSWTIENVRYSSFNKRYTVSSDNQELLVPITGGERAAYDITSMAGCELSVSADALSGGAAAYLCLYSGNRLLKIVKSENKTIKMNMPDSTDGCVLKLLNWNDDATQKPSDLYSIIAK